MNFFDMGIGEILLILVVALIIWGPGKIPEIGRMLGRMVATLRKTSFDLTTQIKKELEEEEKSLPSKSKDSNSDKTEKAPDADTAEPGDTEKSSPSNQ
jgi:sec-independent protein translocase protein TatA